MLLATRRDKPRRNRGVLESPLRARRARLQRRAVEKALAKPASKSRRFNSALLVEPHDILNLSGKPYRVYTPYLRRLLRDLRPRRPAACADASSRAPKTWPTSAGARLPAPDAEDQVVRHDGEDLAARRSRRAQARLRVS